MPLILDLLWSRIFEILTTPFFDGGDQGNKLQPERGEAISIARRQLLEDSRSKPWVMKSGRSRFM